MPNFFHHVDPKRDFIKMEEEILDWWNSNNITKKYIEKNFEDVGERFSQEARNVHYDKKKSKGIYGKATPEETSELIEEGIDVCTLPWVHDKSEN